MVWYGMVWYGMVWYGMVWYGMVWYGIQVAHSSDTSKDGNIKISPIAFVKESLKRFKNQRPAKQAPSPLKLSH